MKGKKEGRKLKEKGKRERLMGRNFNKRGGEAERKRGSEG